MRIPLLNLCIEVSIKPLDIHIYKFRVSPQEYHRKNARNLGADERVITRVGKQPPNVATVVNGAKWNDPPEITVKTVNGRRFITEVYGEPPPP